MSAAYQARWLSSTSLLTNEDRTNLKTSWTSDIILSLILLFYEKNKFLLFHTNVAGRFATTRLKILAQTQTQYINVIHF